MFFAILLRESVRTISRNKMRSVLTVLGISIGIAAVICVVAIGSSATKQYEQQLSNLGDNLIWIENGGRTVNGVRTGTGGGKSLTPGDAEAILKQVPMIKKVSPQVDGRTQAVFENKNWSTVYRGESPDYLEICKWDIAAGTNITQVDVIQAAEVCVFGNTLKEQLFPDQDPIGKYIRVGNFPCKVVGVLAPKGASGFGQDQDDFILLPYTTAQKRIAGITWLKDIMCSATSDDVIPFATQQIVTILRERHRIAPGMPDDFNIRTPQEMIQARIDGAKTFSMLLISIASVALLVGGIGVMNVMLVSVTERTREIGIRMAIGATEHEVRSQFLAEAVALSLLGGLFGIAIGISGSYALGSLMQWDMSVPTYSIGIAFAFASVVGIFFGMYPAVKASQLDPIEALRFE